MVSVRGDVLDTALGKVIDVQAIGSSPEQMTELAGPRPPRGPKGGPDRFGPPLPRWASLTTAPATAAAGANQLTFRFSRPNRRQRDALD